MRCSIAPALLCGMRAAACICCHTSLLSPMPHLVPPAPHVPGADTCLIAALLSHRRAPPRQGDGISVLVLSPTRELASQVWGVCLDQSVSLVVYSWWCRCMGVSTSRCADAVPRCASNLASQARHRLGSACGCPAFLPLHPAAAGAAWSAARLQALQRPHRPTSLPLRLPARRPQIEKEAEQLLRFHPFKAQVVYGETC